jgi:RNA polymerase sigma-70 factor (ECF subfamily)
MSPPSSPPEGAALFARLAPLRPRLHRYCARMVGSTLDAEDLVQDAYVKALLVDGSAAPIDNAEAWMFRVVHNLALDHLRRRAVRAIEDGCEDADAFADPNDEIARRQAGSAGLAVFMRLPALQRSAVILIDVLEHSAEEAASLVSTTVQALKSALQRGRLNLRRWAVEPAAEAERLQPDMLQRLQNYADRFNAGDFAGLQALLSDDVEIDLVNRVQVRGAAARQYFTRYAAAEPWVASVGSVEGRPAVLLRRPSDRPDQVRSFLLPVWQGERIASIRDYLFAPYALEGVAVMRA